MVEHAPTRRGSLAALRLAATIWTVAAACLLLWWAAHYRSLVEGLGEWQFDRFGSYRPSLTVIALLLLATLPVAALLWRQARRERDDARPGENDPVRAMVRRARLGAERARLFFAAMVVVLAAVAGAVAVSALSLPVMAGSPVTIRGGVAVLPEGPALLGGRWHSGRVARFDEDVGFARRTTFVAPVRFVGERQAPARLFVTMVPLPGRGFAPVTSGVLVRHGTPRELRNLYAVVGLRVADDATLLMRDNAQVRWRSWALVGQIAIGAALAGLAWLLSHRRARRLRAAEATLTQIQPHR